MGKQRGKTAKAGENREKQQMGVHRGKPLIHPDKTLLSAGVHSQHKRGYLFIPDNVNLERTDIHIV